jgi:uroporphyrinogen-III synthase
VVPPSCSGRPGDWASPAEHRCPGGAQVKGESIPGPLAGWRVLVPRPVDQAGELSALLRAVGAEPVAVPLIAISPPEDLGPFDLALIDLASGRFAWVGFTSANAVDAVIRRARELGVDNAIPADTKVAAVGPGTAAALRRAGLPVDLVPPGKGSADAIAALWPTAHSGETVLLPRSDIARPGLPDALLAKGYRVEMVTAYRTVVQPLPAGLTAELRADRFHAILLTSPSTVSALARAPIGPGVVLGAIGQPTASAAVTAGRPVTFVAAQPTATALVDGLVVAARDRAARTPLPQYPHAPSTTETRVIS